MARTFKEPPKQNLLRIPVLVEDVRSYSDYFEVSDLNTIFHAGKNGFLLRGSQLLKRNTQVFVEVLDRFDRPVFATAVPNFSEGGARLISVEVFQRTERGPGKLVIVGTANRFADLTSIPEEQTQSPNVRWVVPIVIEPRNENTSKIRLANSPTVTAEEKNFRTTRIDRVTTSDSTYSASVVYDYEVHKSDGYAIQMVDSSGTPVNFFDDVNIDGYFTGSILKVEANRWYADDVEAPSSRSVVSVKDSDDNGYVTASVYLPLTKTLDRSTAISTTPIKFGNKTDFLNPALRSGSYERILKTANLGGGVEKRLVEEITSSVVFQYVSESTVQVSATSSVVSFRIPFVSTHTGEIKKIKIGAKEANENITSFQPFAEFVPSEKNILVTSSAIGDLAVGRFLENSTLQNNWYGGVLNNSSGTFDQAEYESSGSVTYPRTIFTSSAKILEGAYVDHTSGSGTPYYFGTKNFYQLYSDVEYTLKYSAVYSPSYTSGSDTYTTPITGSLKTYLTRIGSGSVARDSSSVVVTDVDPYGQLIDTVNTLTSDKSRYEKEVNFTVQKDGVAYLRFIVDSGFWNFSDIQITPSIEKGFNPDEIIFDAENNFLKDSTNQFKVQFLNFNDEPIQYEVITDPIFLSGSRAVKNFKLIADRSSFTFSGSLASPTAQTASITSELTNITATPSFTVVDDSGSAVQSSLFKLDGNDIEVYPFAPETSSVLVTANVDGLQDKVRLVKIIAVGEAVPGEPAPRINLILDGAVSFVSSSAGVQPAATTSKITGSLVEGGKTYLVSGSISGSIGSGFQTFTAGGGSGRISSSWNRAGTNDVAYEFRFFSQSDASAGTFTQVDSQAYVINQQGDVTAVSGADGSDGTDARAVNLTADDLTFEYNTAGSSPSPTTATITATALNTTGTVYYEFLVTGSSHQNSTTSTFTYPAPPDLSSMPNIIEVKIREGADDSDVKARDQISALGLREGTDAITIEMTNEAHTLPTTAEGVVTYDDSGTDIRVYAGTTPLSASVSATASGVFSVAASGEDITVGSVSTSGSYTRRFADASSCTADTAKITYTITVRDLANTTSTFTKVQSFSKSHQGDPGTPATAFSIKYDDLQTTGATDSAGEYSLLTGSAKNPPSDATGTNTDAKLKSDVTSILLAWKDADSVVRTSVLDNIEIGDTIQYWVSGQRWYSYRVTGISGSAGTAINQKRNRRFAVNPIASDTTDGTGNLPTADGNDVYFRFSRAAPAKPALPPIVYVADTFTSYDNSAGTPTSPTLANSHWATWDTASANYPSADGTFTQTSSLFSNINYIGIGADVSSTKTSYNRVPTAANYVRIHAQTGSFVTIYYNEDNFGVYTYETLEYSTNDVVLGVSHSVSIGTLDSSTPEINFSSPVTSSDGDRGAAGPGILFKGNWDALPSSSIVGQTATSRDVVSVGEPAVYYYFESGSADGSETLDPPQSASKAYIDSESAHPTGSAAARYWKAFESFKAVATDMLLAQDIYTHRTVNVGMTASQGGVNDAAAITLSSDFANSGSNPFISIGQGVYKNYGNAGVFIGSGSGNPKLSLVGSGSSPQYLKWDGAQLDISGSISASSGAINGPLGISGTNAKLYVGSGSYSHSGTPFYVDKDGQFSLRDKFVFDPSDSSLAIAGTISASAGAINGPLGISETGAKIYVGAGTYNNSNTAFYVDNNGSFSLGDQLTFDTSANLSIDGSITTVAGSIGGWDIGTLQISKNSGSVGSAIISSSGAIVLGTGSNTLHLSGRDSEYRMWVGAEEYDSANFLISKTGAITASAGQITGPMQITDSDAKLYVGTGTYSNSNTPFYVDDAGDFSLGNKVIWDNSEESFSITGNISASAGAISGILSVGNLIIGQGAGSVSEGTSSPAATATFTALTNQQVQLTYSGTDDSQVSFPDGSGASGTAISKTTDSALTKGDNVTVTVNIHDIVNISNGGGAESPTAFYDGGNWLLKVYQDYSGSATPSRLNQTFDIGSTFSIGDGPSATFEYGSVGDTKIKFEIDYDVSYEFCNSFSSQNSFQYDLSATKVTPVYSVDEAGFFVDVGGGRVNFASAAVAGTGGGTVGAGGLGVQKTGTPSDNQVAVWTGINNIEGTTGLTFASNTLSSAGNLLINAGDGSNSTPAFSFSSDSNTGMYQPANNEIGFATDGAHRVRIDSSGNVGIGTTSPSGLLHLGQSSSDGLYFTRSGYDTFELSLASDGMRLYNITDTRTDFFVDGDGNVGIGTNSPDNTLHIKNATDISMGSSATGQFRIQGSGYNAAIALDGSNMNIYHNSPSRGLVLGTNETARLTITAGGNVGIGTTSPHDKLHVVGNVFIEDGSPEITLETTSASHRNWQIAAQENVSQALEISVGSQDNDASNDTFTPVIIALYNSTANRVGINDTGPSYELDVTGTINATVEIQVESDIRLKNELPFTVQGLEAVDKLRPIKYTLKSDEDETPKVRLGFSAQEVLEIIPEVVSTDDEGYHAVAYQKLVPVLVKAIQELTEEVRELKKNVEG